MQMNVFVVLPVPLPVPCPSMTWGQGDQPAQPIVNGCGDPSKGRADTHAHWRNMAVCVCVCVCVCCQEHLRTNKTKALQVEPPCNNDQVNKHRSPPPGTFQRLVTWAFLIIHRPPCLRSHMELSCPIAPQLYYPLVLRSGPPWDGTFSIAILANHPLSN